MKSSLVHLLALLVLLGCLSVAQTQEPQQRPHDGGAREVLISILIPSLANAPFSANVNTESIRQLGDGTTITLKNRRAIARDNAGRIFQERRLFVPDDGKHESVVTQIEISDPIAHELDICVPRQGVCQLELFSAPAFAPPPTAGSAGRQPGSPNLEYLGEQSIGGLETVGIREMTVIETGAVGNNSPIEIKREYWYSPQIGINLISKLHDPRIGTQDFEVTDITLGEPDAKLFKLPSHMELIDLRKPVRSPSPSATVSPN